MSFGDQLKWEPRSQQIRIGVDLLVTPLDKNGEEWNRHFADMREKLEKLDEIFQPRIEEIFSEDDFEF